MHFLKNKSQSQNEKRLLPTRRARRLSLISTRLFSLAVVVVFLIYLSYFGIKVHFHETVLSPNDVKEESKVANGAEQPRKPLNNVTAQPGKKHRARFLPCEVPFVDSVTYFLEPEDNVKFSRFSLEYLVREEWTLPSEARFGGHQNLKDREMSYHATNQTIHCGFVRGPDGFPSTGFDLDENDKKYMSACKIVVSSCIFGSSDFLRRPTSKLISEYSKKNVCFVMFVDEQSLAKLSMEGNIPNESGNIGLWKLVVVKNLPYEDLRKTGKVPKFLSHRLFPSSRYSIWLDSKLRLNADPMLIIEYFLWRSGSEFAISNHYTRHCVWEEVLQNKRLNKYNHSVIDKQFHFYQSDGLTKYESSDPSIRLPSFVPEGSFIIRAHTPMSNLFSCLWFNEVDRFTSRDQLSFAYTYLKLKRLNPDKQFYLNMFKVDRVFRTANAEQLQSYFIIERTRRDFADICPALEQT